MKSELCVIGTLLLLSSITGIFNDLVVVKDASAQQVQQAFTQCLKCADLAIIQSGGQAQQTPASDALIGTPTDNIFNTCASDTPQTGFNAAIDATSLNEGQKETVENAFAECLTNAPDSEPTQMESLQDKFITTNERAEPENPTMNTLIENPHFESLLQDPELNAPLVDPEVKALLEDPDVNTPLQNPTIDPPSGVFPLPSGLFP